MVFIKNIFVKLPVSFLIFSILSVGAFAQHGNPYIVNYIPDLKNIDNQNLCIVQGSDGVIYFANRKGVLSYDGFKWNLIKTESSVFSLAHDSSSGQVYVGCRGNFGLLEKDVTGEISYVSLSDQNEVSALGEITKIIITEDGIYYYSTYSLFRFSNGENKIDKIWSAENEKVFTGLLSLQNELYLNVYGEGLKKVENSGLEDVENGEIFSSVEIITAFHYADDTVLLGTNENEIFLFDGKEFKPFTVEAKDYLLESGLVGGLELSSQQFVLSTLTGGCVIIDKKTGNTVNILNYQTGLPDDETYAMGTDRNGGLWLAHDYGISRADISVPVRNYSSYPGIEGNPISVIDYDSTIYVSTTEGVYFLTEVKDFSEVVIYIKEPKKKTEDDQQRIESHYVQSALPLESDTDEPAIEDDPKSKTKSFDVAESKKQTGFKLFGYRVIKEKTLKSKLERKEKTEAWLQEQENAGKNESMSEDVQTEETPQDKLTPGEELQKQVKSVTRSPQKQSMTDMDRFDVKKVYALQSIRYVYKLVNGLKEKCRQMVKFNDLLLVATNTGLYEISNKEASPIVKDQYINYVCRSTNDPNRFYIATASGLFAVYHHNGNIGQPKTGNWEIENNFDNIRESVYSIVEDETNNLWLGSDNSVYHIILDTGALPLKYEQIKFESGSDEPILVRGLYGKPFFFMSSGIYSYDTEGDSIYYDEEINILYPPDSRFIYAQQGITWVHNGEEWRRFNAAKEVTTLKEVYLGLFDNIQTIYVGQENNFWVINKKRELYKIFEDDNPERETIFDLELNALTNDYDRHFSLEDVLTLKYDNSSLKFHLSAPFYLKEGGAIYQYMVDGLMKDWTKWSTDPFIRFPFIPVGNYTISIRAKNILGSKSTVKTFQFRVSPPLWQAWWFYLICMVLGMASVIAFIKLRTRKIEREKKILEIKVAERTEELAKKNKAITDSIKYAQRIQEAVLPVKDDIRDILPSSFILYKPKDIVSGDFYWFTKKGNSVIVAAVDCTGHGVPGAFMSLIGSDLLNNIVEVQGIVKPVHILKAMHKGIVDTLKKDKKSSATVDGMDLAICAVDLKKKTLEYAGAGCPLILIKKGVIELIKGNNYPIGMVFDRKRKPSVYETEEKLLSHKTKLSKGDTFYIFSDGYCDQFGGEDGKKFMGGPFMDLLADIQPKAMSQQEALLYENIEKWRGDNRQIDDMLVIGVRI